MNSVNLTGRIAALKQCEKCLFVTVATAQKKNYSEADFIDCVAFKHTSDFISRNFSKGQFIEIQGYLTKASHNGQYNIRVVIDSANFCGEKRALDI